MNEREKFMYDLQGFLKIENFLSPEEVQELNDAFDANWDKAIPRPQFPRRWRHDGGTAP